MASGPWQIVTFKMYFFTSMVYHCHTAFIKKKEGVKLRNYKKEAAWQKSKYTRLLADIDKEIADAFKEKLKEKKIPYASWLKEQIEAFLKEN